MKFAAAIAAISAAANAVGAVTVAERRDSWTKFKSSDIESWALRAWGPQESLNTDAHLILLDHTIDGKDQITRQKRLGKKVLCYISAGMGLGKSKQSGGGMAGAFCGAVVQRKTSSSPPCRELC